MSLRRLPLGALVGVVLMMILVLPANAQKTVASGGSCPFQIIGHRGTVDGVTRDNTLAAFRAAVADGADVIEMDLRRTKPNSHGRGTWIINHDATLAGHTVATTPYAVLKRLQPDLATFSQVVRWAGTAKVPMEVELKPTKVSLGSMRYVLGLISSNGLSDRTTITSFHQAVLRKVQPLSGPVGIGVISASPVDPAAVQSFATTLVIKHTALTPAYVEQAHTAGLEVEVYTVDSDADFTASAAAGVDGIVTDEAAGLVTWCAAQ